MAKITNISAKKILDSSSKWTVEAKINQAKGSAPSGTSKGRYEAKAIDVNKSVNLINKKLKDVFLGKSFTQKSLDDTLQKLGRTKNFSKIGGNTAIAVSFAFFNANFKLEKNTFPFLLSNVLGGGKHGGFTDIQEFLIFPYNAKNVNEAYEINLRFYQTLDSLLRKKIFVKTNIEKALTAKIKDEKLFEILSRLSDDIPVKIGIDMATSVFWNGKEYIYKNSGQMLDKGEQIDFISELVEKYRLFYVEDPLHEDDFTGFSELNKKIGKKAFVCGDDLTATNIPRLKTAIKNCSINSIIIKPNQVGTITLTSDAVKLAKKGRITPIISHRSNETDDVTISRLAVNWKIPIIKIGFNDKEKINELVRLWHLTKKPRMAKL